MADLTGPFDSAPWSQTEWYGFAPTWAPSGIIGSPAASIGVGDFAVTASGLTLTVACSGDRAWIDGSGYKPDSNKPLTVTANGNASLSRRDRLVIRRDLAAQTIDVVRLPGTAAGTPAAPDLTQISGGIYDVPICSFLVPPNNGTTLSGFVDERKWVDPAGGLTVGSLVFGGSTSTDPLRVATAIGSAVFSGANFVSFAIDYSLAGFTQAPVVTGAVDDAASNGPITFHTSNRTATGAIVTVRTADGSAKSVTIPVPWQAIGH